MTSVAGLSSKTGFGIICPAPVFTFLITSLQLPDFAQRRVGAMSSFTTIRTSIRDTATMYKVLQSIPGAQVQRNVILPLKVGGRGRFDFQVTLGENRASGLTGLFGKLLGTIDVRYFLVYRDDDGRLCIEVNQDQIGHRSIEMLVNNALRAEDEQQRQKEVERAERMSQRLEEVRRLQEQQEAKFEEQRRLREQQAAQQARRSRQMENERRAEQSSAAEQEAEKLLSAMTEERAEKQTVSGGGQPAGRPGGASADAQQAIEQGLSAALAQEYAKERVLEQLDDIHSQFGVALGGVETLEDGTIEITLRG